MDKPILFRASGAGGIMPAPASKVAFTETCIGKLVEIYNNSVFGRYEEQHNKYTDNGLDCEEDSITLYSRVKKKIFVKNVERLSNDYVTGEWDLHLEDQDGRIEHTVDIKSSWSKNTFDKSRLKASVNSDYYWQGLTYMWLTGAKTHTVAFCLVNGSFDTIMDEKKRLAWRLGVIDPSAKLNDKYVKGCKQIEVNHIFDLELFKKQNPGFDFDNDLGAWCYDIPMEARVAEFTFERSEVEIERLRLRIIQCREHMANVLFKQ